MVSVGSFKACLAGKDVRRAALELHHSYPPLTGVKKWRITWRCEGAFCFVLLWRQVV